MLAARLGIKEYFPDSDDEIIKTAINDSWAERIGFTLIASRKKARSRSGTKT